MTAMTTAEYRANAAQSMSEADLLLSVRSLARTLGWMTYHTYRSTRSEPGFPDLVLMHPKHLRTIFAELKSQRGEVTSAQDTWLYVADACGHEVHIWRPSHLIDGTIADTLRAGVES